MKEYRIMAYFNADAPKGYQSRSYKRKVFTTKEDAILMFPEACIYYAGYKYLDRVVIESRVVSEWEKEV